MKMITKTVTSSYDVGPEDEYIGVNADKPTTINLPEETDNGRVIIVKAEMKPPIVHRTITIRAGEKGIDGYSNRIIQVSNEVVSLVYNNGWRLI